ncbi:MAG: thymidine phosphorylase [Oscillospiraceae bacterium]|nr:thymidine phosphorylase [Oscillospiraceae bacterium]
MRMYDIIAKKKNGAALSDGEIRFFIDGFTSGDIPDYQAAALLMAICLKGMDAEETAALTGAMARSGDMADLSAIPGVKADKHSTGGVGDKTSIVAGPIAAACGVAVAKMSGRGLGHTGGTVDKLEAIPGMRTAIDAGRFISIVRETGLAIIGQSGNIAPADKKLYALRDVTATVDCVPLIASSIMSKKLASGADAILLDVKTGSGAFMKTTGDAVALAQAMVSIGELNGRRVMALITDMDVPLGSAIGNALEVREAFGTLKGRGPSDLTAICLELSANMLFLAGKGHLDNCRAMAKDALYSGRAFERLTAMISAQGGDASAELPSAPVKKPFKAAADGFITRMDTELCGLASVALGAGRARKDDPIDHAAGIMLERKTGGRVAAGDTLAVLHTSDAGRLSEAEAILSRAIVIGGEPPAPSKTVIAAVDANGVEYF